MDDMVRQAMAKWPDVPDCFGWLGLDSRGHWWMRDDRAQSLGSFQSGLPGAKGSLLRHEKLIDFIHRNYEADAQGRWYFQNGPQRVYIELEATPHVWRLSDQFEVHSHTGVGVKADLCLVDETGRVYLDTAQGLGLVHSLDVERVANALDLNLWPLRDCVASELPKIYGYVTSPQEAWLGHQQT
ncbi:DUF2946 family protein [Limnohabitans sp. Bal53]|uniref:DUF2946 family protein n=1 Tax=Limnohabitans sp. Bal53 TaxID=1977910 RepID=UPI000D376A15|nr:DUF2946 family protein [Limnohabitans sp. Bal53]PUE40543.1 hypothetical protein B9Z50_09645 [Limnohabitans sp. Bal53]